MIDAFISISISIYLSIYLSIHLSIYPSIYLSMYLSIYLSSIYLSIYTHTHIYISRSIVFLIGWLTIDFSFLERASDWSTCDWECWGVACFHPIPRTERIPTFAGSWTFNIPRSTSHASNTNQGYPPYSNVAMEIPISIYIYISINTWFPQ